MIISFVVEVILSAMIAPIMMLIHSGAVLSILMGQDSGWNPQRRDDGSLPIKHLIYRHRWHMIAGILLTVAGYLNSLALLAWLSPAIIGMLLSVPLSMLTSSWALGNFIKKCRILSTQYEKEQPSILIAMNEAKSIYEQSVIDAPDLARMASDPKWYARHLAVIDAIPTRKAGQVDIIEATATMKISDAKNVAEAVSYLNKQEQAYVLATPDLFKALSALAR
ncbi:hypothetical protein [Psychromonas sp. KJ10-2]|uniref:hypothetical protein n=1 Tax=Psychromonas sp. KJ10-2 TaxID=3391822 RepID=UPI0039B6AAE5